MSFRDGLGRRENRSAGQGRTVIAGLLEWGGEVTTIYSYYRIVVNRIFMGGRNGRRVAQCMPSINVTLFSVPPLWMQMRNDHASYQEPCTEQTPTGVSRRAESGDLHARHTSRQTPSACIGANSLAS